MSLNQNINWTFDSPFNGFIFLLCRYRSKQTVEYFLCHLEVQTFVFHELIKIKNSTHIILQDAGNMQQV